MTMKYVCLLRGINVGGNKKVPMADLKKMMESLGHKNVKTLLNSGNVVFETEESGEKTLVSTLEESVRKTFGFDSSIMVRSMPEIKALIDLDPFSKIEVTKDVRLNVSFLREPAGSNLSLPYEPDDSGFRIVAKTDREVFSALMLKTARTVDAMAFLEREYGKDITTRNWNTVVKIAGL